MNRFPIQATPFVIPITILISTGLLGVWTTYNPSRGLLLFIMLVVGLLGYFTLAHIPASEVSNAAVGIGLIGAILTTYFLLSHDWQIMPANFALLRRVSIKWMELRPELSLPPIHPNIVAGNLASVFPLVAAASIHHSRAPHPTRFRITLASLIIISLGLIMTSSRAAWIFLLGTLFLGWLFGWWQNARVKYSKLIVWLIIISCSLAIGGLIILYQQGFFDFVVSNSVTLTSRVSLARNSLALASDTILTGSGLGSFPGNYSTYILLTPVLMFSYAHNMYLDILIEQGIFGLLGWLGFWFGATAFLISSIRRSSQSSSRPIHALGLPILAGLVIIAFHGLIDNPFAEAWSRPFIGLLPGLAMAVTNDKSQHWVRNNSQDWYALGITVILLSISLTVIKPLSSMWKSNLGAIELARKQLSEWPTGEWLTQAQVIQYSSASNMLEQALQLDRDNLTAHYRLGLVAMQATDFQTAQHHLEAAINLSPDHRGIIKALGYCYLWQGKSEPGLRLLRRIPEAYQELQAYSGWWKIQGKPELAAFAQEYAAILSD